MWQRFGLFALIWPVAMDSSTALAGDPLSFEETSHLTPSDYLFGSKGDQSDSVFDGAKPIDLGVDLGLGADCGRVDFHNTLRSTLKNMLDSKYFGDLGRDIVAGSPMLLACYMSPTWCAILKHSQLSANFLSQMRLSQCAIIDKFVDARTEDYYRERQTCAQQYIQQNGGDLETAMESCGNVWNAGLSDWAGGKDGKVSTNQLIESSAKWAGFEGEEAKGSVDLLKSMIGDTVISQGKVSVDFGSKGHPATPATHLQDVQRQIQKNLCDDLMTKVSAANGAGGADQVVTDGALRGLSAAAGEPLIDRQTVEALAYMPRRERQLACRRLANAMGLTVFTKDLNRSLDILSAAAQNPNLPPNRKAEIEEKRRTLKDSVDLAVTLGRERDTVLTEVQAQINEAGSRRMAERAAAAISADRAGEVHAAAQFNFMDCSDGIMCGGQ